MEWLLVMYYVKGYAGERPCDWLHNSLVHINILAIIVLSTERPQAGCSYFSLVYEETRFARFGSLFIFTSYRIRNYPTITLPFVIIATNTVLVFALNNSPRCKISTDCTPGFLSASRDLAIVGVFSARTNHGSNSDSIWATKINGCSR